MRIVFAGTPEFAATGLKAVIRAGHSIAAVYTQPDRRAGRGRKLRPSAVKSVALDHGIPLEQPANLKGSEAHATLSGYACDLMVVAAYGLILPQHILDTPRLGCVNVHASLLPRWRGAAPIQRAILAGDPITGISIMQMDAGLDTGDVLLERQCIIEANDTGGSLHDRLSLLGATTLCDALTKLERNELQPRPQPTEGVTYAHRLNTAEAVIDWTMPATAIERLVRAFDPWPVARTGIHREWLRVFGAVADTNTEAHAPPGTVLSAERTGISVATGQGTLRLTRLQRPGGKPLPVDAYLNGTPIIAGETLEPPP